MRARLGSVALLLALAGAAWWLAADRMGAMAIGGMGMGMSGGAEAQLGTLGWFVITWIVMMAAMMLPSLSPTVALYARMTRRRGLDRVLLFSGGYLLVWGAAGAFAYGVFAAGSAAFGRSLAWDRAGSAVAAGLVRLNRLFCAGLLILDCDVRPRNHRARGVGDRSPDAAIVGRTDGERASRNAAPVRVVDAAVRCVRGSGCDERNYGRKQRDV